MLPKKGKIVKCISSFLLMSTFIMYKTNVTHAETISGIALKNPTNIYSDTTSHATIYKSYGQGTPLKYYAYSNDWYTAWVYVNGVAKKGYISHNDVDNEVKEKQWVRGIATLKTTSVYSKASTDSKKLKSYTQGTILKYQTYTSRWYKTTVYLKGKIYTGYISKSHVENITPNQPYKYGISLQYINVYRTPSTSSIKWKSYGEGTVLNYEPISNHWVQVTVYVNGIKKTGYIYKNYIEEVLKPQDRETLDGIVLSDGAKVYNAASLKSTVWRNYAEGQVITYQTFANNWYLVNIYIGGKKQTGYIPKTSIETTIKVANRETLEGVALMDITNVYAYASQKSPVVRKYNAGTILKYQTFANNWYKIYFYSNGVRKTGYLYKKDAINTIKEEDREILKGLVISDTANVYQLVSNKSKVLTSYTENQPIEFRPITSDWYEMTKDGVPQKQYIQKKDVQLGYIRETQYNLTLDSALTMQMNASPKADGAGTVAATRDQVESYLNPLNVDKNSSDYYQFLVLSQPAGLDPKEVNDKILFNKNVFQGKAQAFIDGANTYKINEIYLISHALHETGNGTSTLAKGIPVDANGTIVTADKAAYTVYNMYGIGAADACPQTCGAKTAFDNKWFTPEAAIIGGAKFVGENYIHNSYGQDTLYKMKWNPDGMQLKGYATHQYATHIAWAVLQTTNIKNFYDMIDNYTLIFDVPKYQP